MKFDKEIHHRVHSQHRLKLEFTETPFTCDGCKEAGIGLKYTCKVCEFDLHKTCAVAPLIITHPFYERCQFQFYYNPPGKGRRLCDACRREVCGFVYHCNKCDFDMHPCCVNLPRVLDDGETNIYLCMKISDCCLKCGGKGHGWAYRSKCRSYNLHVACVKELMMESWQAMCLNLDKKKAREVQSKIPSLKETLKNHHRGSKGGNGKLKKCCEIAGGAIRLIVGAMLGDPSAVIAAVVGGFISV
ncbi:hypothetical protein ACFE04_013870 [Oxalis oulophora]